MNHKLEGDRTTSVKHLQPLRLCVWVCVCVCDVQVCVCMAGRGWPGSVAQSDVAWCMKCNKFRYLCIIYVVIWYFSPKTEKWKASSCVLPARTDRGQPPTAPPTSAPTKRENGVGSTLHIFTKFLFISLSLSIFIFRYVCVCVCAHKCMKTHKLHLQHSALWSLHICMCAKKCICMYILNEMLSPVSCHAHKFVWLFVAKHW